MVKHIPPAGQSLIVGHTCTLNGECVCNPTRIVKTLASTSGKGGKHQGYRQQVSYQHHFIDKEQS